MSPRYDEIESKMTPFLKLSGYNVKKGIGRCLFLANLVSILHFLLASRHVCMNF